MQDSNRWVGTEPRVATRQLTPVAPREELDGYAWTALLLRGVDLGGAVGLVVDESARVLAASDGFRSAYAARPGCPCPASLAALGVDGPLSERIRRAVHDVVTHGPFDVPGGAARRLEGEASGSPIVLLVAMPSRAVAAPRGAADLDVVPRRAARVLLVEDDEQVRAQARRSLAGDEFDVHAVACAKAALELVEAGARFDVLVTDVVMPAMSGPELAEELAGFLPHLGVLFVSGYADGSLVDSGSPDAPRAFLAKPHTPAALRVAVAGLWRELSAASCRNRMGTTRCARMPRGSRPR